MTSELSRAACQSILESRVYNCRPDAPLAEVRLPFRRFLGGQKDRPLPFGRLPCTASSNEVGPTERCSAADAESCSRIWRNTAIERCDLGQG